jgi:hypothetical protein
MSVLNTFVYYFRSSSNQLSVASSPLRSIVLGIPCPTDEPVDTPYLNILKATMVYTVKKSIDDVEVGLSCPAIIISDE